MTYAIADIDQNVELDTDALSKVKGGYIAYYQRQSDDSGGLKYGTTFERLMGADYLFADESNPNNRGSNKI